MDHSSWLDNLYKAIAEVGDEGRAAVDYLRRHRTKIGFKLARSNVAAFWTVFGNIRLNSHYYDYDTSFDDLRIKTLIIHEVRHLQQGLFAALSVYGELDAWQLEFSIYHRIKGHYPKNGDNAIAKLMDLPLEYNRDVLKQAAKLMQDYSGKGYRIDLLPLYPLGREIRYWLTRK